jgi:hypothetical protein
MAATDPFVDVHAGQIDRVSRKLSAAEIRASAYTMAALGAVAYAEARLATARIFASCIDHGLTVAELVEASGRTEAFVSELLAEAEG